MEQNFKKVSRVQKRKFYGTKAFSGLGIQSILHVLMDMSDLLDDSIVEFISADYENADTTEFDQLIAAFPDSTHSLLSANPSPSNTEAAPIPPQPLPSFSSVANTRFARPSSDEAMRREAIPQKKQTEIHSTVSVFGMNGVNTHNHSCIDFHHSLRATILAHSLHSGGTKKMVVNTLQTHCIICAVVLYISCELVAHTPSLTSTKIHPSQNFVHHLTLK